MAGDNTAILIRSMDGKPCACGKRIIDASSPKLEATESPHVRKTGNERFTEIVKSCEFRCTLCGKCSTFVSSQTQPAKHVFKFDFGSD